MLQCTDDLRCLRFHNGDLRNLQQVSTSSSKMIRVSAQPPFNIGCCRVNTRSSVRLQVTGKASSFRLFGLAFSSKAPRQSMCLMELLSFNCSFKIRFLSFFAPAFCKPKHHLFLVSLYTRVKRSHTATSCLLAPLGQELADLRKRSEDPLLFVSSLFSLRTVPTAQINSAL